MLSSTKDLGLEHEGQTSAKTWKRFVKEHEDYFGPDCYTIGTFHMLQKVEQILKVEDFTEMKDKLTSLYEERFDLVRHAMSSFP